MKNGSNEWMEAVNDEQCGKGRLNLLRKLEFETDKILAN